MAFMRTGYIPHFCYWMKQVKNATPKIFNVGVDANLFDNKSFIDDPIFNICFHMKSKNINVDESQYLGTLFNHQLQIMHFMTPIEGKIVRFNNDIPYSHLKLKDLSNFDNWLYTIVTNSPTIS